MYPKLNPRLALVSVLTFLSFSMCGQISINEIDGSELNTINTAVPFITIAPDCRSGGMGDAGVASLPDVNSQHWNSAKYAFLEGRGGASLSYTPWLRKIIPDINLLYLSGYYKLNNRNAISGSMRYFPLGEINYSNFGGNNLGYYTSFELAIDAAYSRKFGNHFSTGVALRYIHSDLTSGLFSSEESIPGRSVAADLGFYYENEMHTGERNDTYALGLNLTNIGTPIHYTSDSDKVPIPTNLRLGGRYSFSIFENQSVSLMLDVNKLLVPTPPWNALDSISGEYYIAYGMEKPETVFEGMIQSFYDAPGYVLSDGSRSVLLEELHEIMISAGLEYKFKDLLVIRTGYFHEHASKGNRKYLNFGLGYTWRSVTFDIAYLLPVNGKESPLANTVRFMLSFEV